ncbi:hypothetical protein HHK36_017891 [Tetracentron sinense]|uniref:Protein N-lysine methyltransferase METTL21A n=1 Tax=Tetracentron sinense TaxID=13715 RepID=A0A834Z2W8_TETSI|nr:hypothetical protein HHK36_017891 [Tetracentron sinense]
MYKEIVKKMEREEDDEIVCLDESFFINDNYQLTTFTFGHQVLQLLCLQAASTDFDLTGQLVWPGAMLMNNYISKNADMLQGCSVIELGSGVGITGLLCSRFCREVILTDHNDEVLKILKKNIELHVSSESPSGCFEIVAEKLEWGNSDQISQIIQRYLQGFDLPKPGQRPDLGVHCTCLTHCMLGLFIWQLLCLKGVGRCKFILAYVSRAKIMDTMVINEAIQHGMQVSEVPGTRSVVGNLEGVIFEITLQ